LRNAVIKYSRSRTQQGLLSISEPFLITRN
jgi:hypothetical protein